jgi:hypothetical protein
MKKINAFIAKVIALSKMVYGVGNAYEKLKYWYPVIKEDRDEDFICLFVLIHHKLKSVKAALYPNGNSAIDSCILKFDAIIKMEFPNNTEMQNAVNDAFNVLGINAMRWYK